MRETYIPREDSYLMKEVIEYNIPESRTKKNLKVLEMGSGSGILLDTILNQGISKENIFSADINSDAVKKCRELGFNSIESDLFEKINGKFDIIIFNPPYLPEDKKEPKNSKISTTGGHKGSETINRFLEQAKEHLKKNGKIFLLTSSLTEGINWYDYKKRKVASRKLFMEELYVWMLENS